MREPAFKAAFDQNPKLGCALTTVLCAALIGVFVSNCSGPSDKAPEAQSSYDAAKEEELRSSISTKVEAESNLKTSLKDPDSADFRGETVYKLPGGNLILCGEINSRNSFGGYTGFKRFIASPNPDAPSVIDGETILGRRASRKMFNKAFDKACAYPVHSF